MMISFIVGFLFFWFGSMDSFLEFFLSIAAVAFIFWLMRGPSSKKESKKQKDIHENDRDRIIEEK